MVSVSFSNSETMMSRPRTHHDVFVDLEDYGVSFFELRGVSLRLFSFFRSLYRQSERRFGGSKMAVD